MKFASPRRAVLAVSMLAAGAMCLASGETASALTISPLDGTPDASPVTQISFLGVTQSDISGVSVVGTRSGRHAGVLRSYASATGASFVPAKAFTQGESVSVHARVGPRSPAPGPARCSPTRAGTGPPR